MNELFVKIAEAYNLKDENLLEVRIRDLMDANIENPFEEKSEERDLYLKTKNAYRRWKTKSISGRRGRVEMYEYGKELAKKIAEKNKLAKEQQKKEKASIEMKPAVTEYDLVKLEVPEHVLGILPEKKKSFLKKKAKQDDSI